VGEAEDPNFQRLLKVVRSAYRPGVVVAAASSHQKDDIPTLLHNRPMVNDQATVYVCEGFVCKMPVTEADALKDQLGK
jgi:uncharacterized protein YyaL (SSP411 family)